MNIRMLLAGGTIAAALALGACHKSDQSSTTEANAVTELPNMAEASNMADTNANDEMMNEDMGSAGPSNAQ